jgi:membrane-associated phospholipid phosphatase
LMGISRAYLAAHWLSDAIAGILLGWSCALLVAVATNELQRRRGPEPARAPVPDTARPAERR